MNPKGDLSYTFVPQFDHVNDNPKSGRSASEIPWLTVTIVLLIISSSLFKTLKVLRQQLANASNSERRLSGYTKDMTATTKEVSEYINYTIKG